MPATELKTNRLRIRIPISIYGLIALLISIAGVGIRLALIAQGWPYANADEGTYGMMAIDIAFHGAHPIFMYGQHYMGTTQAYIAAVFFHLSGISLFNLRLGLVILFGLFLIAMYWLTGLLYTRGLALVTLLVLIFGSSYVFYRQIQAVGGWAETLFFGALLYFLASWLALTAHEGMSTKRRRLRLVAFFGWGLVTGLSLWSDIVIAPFILTSGLLLLIFCRRELRSWKLVLLLVGLLVGSSPAIIYNIQTTLLSNSLVTSVSIFGGGVAGHSRLYYLLQGTLGVLLIGLPAITGSSFTCDVNQTLFFNGSGPAAVQCTIGDSLWSLVWLALWASAVYLCFRAIGRSPRKRSDRTPEQQQALARQAARLGLLVAAMISLALFALNVSSIYTPLLSSRYILFIWIATPALLYPLWQGSGAMRASAGRASNLAIPGSKWLILLGIMLLLLWGTVKTFQLVPGTQATLAQQEALVSSLERIGVVHIYSDYWTCDRVIFQSQERIICDTLDNNLNQGFVRYPPDAAAVQSDPKASYVFLSNIPQAAMMARRAAQSPGQYRRYMFDGYVVYQPV